MATPPQPRWEEALAQAAPRRKAARHARGCWWVRLHPAAVFTTVTAVVALAILGLVLAGAIGTPLATFLAVLGATTFSVLLFNETREDRLAQRRPFVATNFALAHGERTDQRVVLLRIQNLGQHPAADVRLRFDPPLRDQEDRDLAADPLLVSGIRYAGPGWTFTKPLGQNTALAVYLANQPRVEAGKPPPPAVVPRIKVAASYRDGITRRPYQETFWLDFAPEVYGWQVSTS